MANKLHDAWTAAKKHLEDEVKDFKSHGGLIAKPVEDALKTFNQGFGPALDKVAAAYKAKKDADIKKEATAALTIASRYKTTLDGLLRTPGMSSKRADAIRKCGQGLSEVRFHLADLQQKGAASANPF